VIIKNDLVRLCVCVCVCVGACACKCYGGRASTESGAGAKSCRRKYCSDFGGTVSWVLTTVMESHNDEMAVLINPLSLYSLW